MRHTEIVGRKHTRGYKMSEKTDQIKKAIEKHNEDNKDRRVEPKEIAKVAKEAYEKSKN